MRRPEYVPPQHRPDDRFDVIKKNWLSLPRWLRRGIRPLKTHDHGQEEERRRWQITAGTLGPSSRGVVRVA